jgi:hypothetical protein
MYGFIDVNNWAKYSYRERLSVAKRLGHLNNVVGQAVPSELKPADITKIADQRIRQMMKSTRRNKR